MAILIFLAILVALVFVHELGHFAVAKWVGMRVDEFGIGFPPKVFGIRKGETEYTLNLLPIGGFVKIYGEDAVGVAHDATAGSFTSKSKWAQAAVLVAGVTMNVLFAWALASIAFGVGVPTVVGELAGGEAQIEVRSYAPLAAMYAGGEFVVTGLRDITVGLSGLIRDAVLLRADFSSVAGPVGIVGYVGEASQHGFSILLMFTAFISLNLAVINILPFPALDGGRLAMVAIEAVKGSPIRPHYVGVVNMVGFLILMILMVAVTWNDIARLL